MSPEFQKPRVTEIQVRMDCNGCVQKIKKALHGISGICDLYIDFPEQRLTIIGWADPELIVKAIKKTRKNAIICSHFEPTESSCQPAAPPSQPTEQATEGNAPPPAPDTTQQPAEALPAEAEPPNDQPPPEQLPPESTPPPNPIDNNSSEHAQSIPGTKEVGEVHVIHHHPPNYETRYGFGPSYVGNWDRCHNRPEFLQEALPPIYVTHSYNTFRPSPYVTEYEYVRSSPRHTHMEHYYSEDYYHNGNNGNITSMFSDENPNACTIS